VNATNFNKILYGIEPLQYAEYDSKYSGFYGVHPDAMNTDECANKITILFYAVVCHQKSMKVENF